MYAIVGETVELRLPVECCLSLKIDSYVLSGRILVAIETQSKRRQRDDARERAGKKKKKKRMSLSRCITRTQRDTQ